MRGRIPPRLILEACGSGESLLSLLSDTKQLAPSCHRLLLEDKQIVANLVSLSLLQPAQRSPAKLCLHSIESNELRTASLPTT